MKRYESQFRKLSEVGSVNRGKSKHRPRNAPELYGGPYPFVQTGDVKAANFFITDYTQTYSERGLAQSKLWQPGTLLITIAANIAETAVLKIPACFPDSIIGFIPRKDESDVRFIKYCLGTYKSQMQSISQGTTQDNLSQGKLLSLRFRIPDYDQQRKIAAVLSAYDELIENNQRRIALLEKLAEEIYREWFVRLRFPGHEKVKVVKGVPTSWEVRTLGSFASEMKRGVKKRDLADDEKYVGLEHIPRRSIALKDWATGDTVDSNKLLFQDRDILFSKIRPYLHKVALTHFSGACSSDTIVIRPKEKVYEGYLLFTVFSDTFIELATVAAKGTKMPRADWGFLKKLELAVPNKKLLELYQAQFDSVFTQIVNLLRANELLASCRDRLLPRLISGKLCVENLAIQFPPGMAEELHAEATATLRNPRQSV